MKKKYPKIEPKIRKDNSGKPKEVFLDMSVFKSIFAEIEDLEKKISELKKKKQK